MAIFEKYKEIAMRDLEEAKQRGVVDESIVPYLDIINKHSGLYTTSSCYGRITIDIVPLKENKKDHKWLGKWHRTVDIKEVESVIEPEIDKIVWLKQDPFIIHIGSKNLELAEKLINIARNRVGLKRTGIMQIHPRVMIEIMGLDTMASPLYIGENKIYKNLKDIIKIANYKFKRNEERLKKFIKYFNENMD